MGSGLTRHTAGSPQRRPQGEMYQNYFSLVNLVKNDRPVGKLLSSM